MDSQLPGDSIYSLIDEARLLTTWQVFRREEDHNMVVEQLKHSLVDPRAVIPR